MTSNKEENHAVLEIEVGGIENPNAEETGKVYKSEKIDFSNYLRRKEKVESVAADDQKKKGE